LQKKDRKTKILPKKKKCIEEKRKMVIVLFFNDTNGLLKPRQKYFTT